MTEIEDQFLQALIELSQAVDLEISKTKKPGEEGQHQALRTILMKSQSLRLNYEKDGLPVYKLKEIEAIIRDNRLVTYSYGIIQKWAKEWPFGEMIFEYEKSLKG